jgi:predicted ATPase
VKRDYLRAIRDCAFDPAIFESFKNEEGMQSSLLRTVTTHDVRVNFPRILRGDTQLTAYEFIFEFETGSVGTTEKCEFSVEPDSMPPTKVHVLIGRNGVGKTRLLAGMADALTENKVKSMGLIGEFQFGDDANEFLNTIVVSYSAFDRFDPLNIGRRRSKTSIPYFYIGIKKQKEPAELGDTVADSIVLKNASDFNYEFRSSLNALADQASKRSHRYGRWLRALDVLRSDPGLAEFVSQFFGVHQETNLDTQAEQFALLSSGHKIVLLTVAKLVENVSDRSLILMDEPETHLHPPLLGSFIRAVSDLLTSQNGVAIIATHSPVVLQEVPARCVSVITRSGHRIRIRRPKTETFAENVGMLTRRVFGLEVTQSGFYRLLKEAAEGRDFGDVLKEFGDQIGGEGRALARVFTSENDEEE